jgi:TM2 domain-containing membrane protein YozV
MQENSQQVPHNTQNINVNVGQAHMQHNYSTITSDKSKTTTLICACVSLIGIGGIHHFYTGKILSGIIHLCTFGLLWIGTIIDILQILTGTFRDGAGAPIRK